MKYLLITLLTTSCGTIPSNYDPIMTVHSLLSDYVKSTGYVPKKRKPKTITYVSGNRRYRSQQ